jgi:hypothetical protein
MVVRVWGCVLRAAGGAHWQFKIKNEKCRLQTLILNFAF